MAKKKKQTQSQKMVVKKALTALGHTSKEVYSIKRKSEKALKILSETKKNLKKLLT